MNYLKRFRVKPGTKVKLSDIDPDFKDDHKTQEDAREQIEENARRLRALQELMYAERKRSLLICLQAMDAGGKDGTIDHVLGAMNPQGCRAVSRPREAAAPRRAGESRSGWMLRPGQRGRPPALPRGGSGHPGSGRVPSGSTAQAAPRPGLPRASHRRSPGRKPNRAVRWDRRPARYLLRC